MIFQTMSGLAHKVTLLTCVAHAFVLGFPMKATRPFVHKYRLTLITRIPHSLMFGLLQRIVYYERRAEKKPGSGIIFNKDRISVGVKQLSNRVNEVQRGASLPTSVLDRDPDPFLF